MTTIKTNNEICTLSNVFSVEPEKQLELFENLKEATQQIMGKMPGYISANIHMGDNGKTVTNYAQWASLEDFKNMLKNEDAQKHMKLAASIATGFTPVSYNIIWAHSNND